MSVIVSSNRSPAEWDAYVERHQRTSLRDFIAERPHQPVEDPSAVIARHAVTPFDHVIAVDECGAPILDPARHHLVRCENR